MFGDATQTSNVDDDDDDYWFCFNFEPVKKII